MSDLENKKTFLYEGALIFDRLISLAPDDAIRRYLAFRIIVNAMSFEDLVGQRQQSRIREIRNVMLAHKQKADFFDGYSAIDEVRDASIQRLISSMRDSMVDLSNVPSVPELSDTATQKRFEALSKTILQKYFDEELSGARLTNNFLCFTGEAIQEISSSDLAGCFFRYSSSKSLMSLAMYFTNNLYADNSFLASTRLMKLDLILHAQNMFDTVFKDMHNQYSIEGLLEIMIAGQVGDPSRLRRLNDDPSFQNRYLAIRNVRNKLIAHIDRTEPLNDLINDLDGLSTVDIYQFINDLDFAVYQAARSHIAIWNRYAMQNVRLNDGSIVAICGLTATPYY